MDLAIKLKNYLPQKKKKKLKMTLRIILTVKFLIFLWTIDKITSYQT